MSIHSRHHVPRTAISPPPCPCIQISNDESWHRHFPPPDRTRRNLASSTATTEKRVCSAAVTRRKPHCRAASLPTQHARERCCHAGAACLPLCRCPRCGSCQLREITIVCNDEATVANSHASTCTATPALPAWATGASALYNCSTRGTPPQQQRQHEGQKLRLQGCTRQHGAYIAAVGRGRACWLRALLRRRVI